MAQTQSDNDLTEQVPQTVLVVDDSEQVRTLLRRMLEGEGYVVRVAGNGAEALSAIAKESPDLVLMDVMMPGMDGLSALRRLRSRPETAELPVILVTALDTVDQIVRGLDLGANDYLTKPIQLEVLMARARTQLKIKRLQDERRRDIQRLRELDELKDKFLQIAAHDLRNPLANIALGLEWLGVLDVSATDQAEKYREVVAMMRMATGMMKSIVNDYLALQALRAGQVRVRPEPVALNDIVQDTVSQFRAYADRKEVTVQFDLASNLPVCRADPRHIAQVVSNLISNAIKFSPQGAKVRVGTRKHENAIRVEVEDNGPGIPEEEMPLLFQEFARLTPQPTGGEHSSGVGLAIVRHLVELHQGHVGADSQVGRGSLFWFEIPG